MRRVHTPIGRTNRSCDLPLTVLLTTKSYLSTPNGILLIVLVVFTVLPCYYKNILSEALSASLLRNEESHHESFTVCGICHDQDLVKSNGVPLPPSHPGHRKIKSGLGGTFGRLLRWSDGRDSINWPKWNIHILPLDNGSNVGASVL